MAQSRGRGGSLLRPVGGRLIETTPGQAARLDISEMQAQAAVQRVRQVDPNWRPTPSFVETVEGQIKANQAVVREAEIRLTALRATPLVQPERPPLIPSVRPQPTHQANAVVKQVATWLGAFGDLAILTEEASWLYESAHRLVSYLDPPRTLAELQAAVASPTRGYDIHHIVERALARQAKLPASLIDGPTNLARIPTLKHWQITGWYMTPNRRFAGRSPRDYLQDKDWNERFEVGKEALVLFKVLKP